MPGEHVTVDHAEFELSKRNNKYTLVLVDINTRFVFLEPLEDKEKLCLLLDADCIVSYRRRRNPVLEVQR